jgi:hypothetical protein
VSPFKKNLLLLCCNLAVWAVNSFTYSSGITLFAKKGIAVVIQTTPPRTKLSVNGAVWRGTGITNGWVQSPARINLIPGQHKITLERPGYIPHSFKVLVTESDSEMRLNSELEISTEANSSVEIDVTDEDLQTATFILDQGLEIAAPPLIAQDLTPGMHILEIRKSSAENSKSKPFLCTFSIPSAGNATYKITVSAKNGRIQASNCLRLKKL